MPGALSLAAVLAAPGGAAAALAAPGGARLAELTPLLGRETGAELALFPAPGETQELDLSSSGTDGAFLDFAVTPEAMLGAMYLRQDALPDTGPLGGSGGTGLTMELEHRGGEFSGSRQEALRPFVVAPVGAGRLEAEGSNSDTRPRASIGFGLRLFAGRHSGPRLEARHHGMLVDDTTEAVCGGTGAGIFHGSGTILSRVDAKQGLVIGI